jgi:HEAT repeat protein
MFVIHMRLLFGSYPEVLKAVAFDGSPTPPKSARTLTTALQRVVAAGVAVVLITGCDRGVDARIRHAHALAGNPSEPNKDRIEALLKDRDQDVRATAIVVMDGVDRDRAKRMAVQALRDPDALVRAAAVPICGDGADDETIRALATQAVSDPAWQVRARALEAIAGSDAPVVYDAFAQALFDSAWGVRRAALLAGTGRPGLLPTDQVVELLITDSDWENRVEAARALGSSQDRAAYTGLDAAGSDPNEFVRAIAARERRTLEAAGVSR